jgi:hypothetical protein
MAWKWIRISLESWMVSWWFWYKNKIVQAHVSNCTVHVSNILVPNIHTPVYLGSRGKPFFWNSEVFFVVSADCRLVRFCIYKFVLYEFTHINLYVNLFFYTISYAQICTYKFVQINKLMCTNSFYEFVHTKLYKKLEVYHYRDHPPGIRDPGIEGSLSYPDAFIPKECRDTYYVPTSAFLKNWVGGKN